MMAPVNACAVGVQGQTVVVLVPRQRFTPQEAVEFAAYLIVMAKGVSTVNHLDPLPDVAELVRALEAM